MFKEHSSNNYQNYSPNGEFFSPYLGMGNNPIKFVDIDGGIIKLFFKGKSYTYKNGRLFNDEVVQKILYLLWLP